MPTAKSISFKKMDLTKQIFWGEGFHYYFTVYLNTYISQFHGNWNSFGSIFDDGEKFRLKSVAAIHFTEVYMCVLKIYYKILELKGDTINKNFLMSQ